MEIKHNKEAWYGEFYIEREGVKMGKLTYHRERRQKITISHTEVDPQLQGTGASGKLIDAVAGYAREARIKIDPRCPFAQFYMGKYPDKYKDVLV